MSSYHDILIIYDKMIKSLRGIVLSFIKYEIIS